MNIENLTEGLILKNYKAVCEAVGEPVKTGKAKQLQLTDWERYFTYSKSGNSFIINKIHTEPIEKVDNRGKSSIYSNAIQLLISDLLARKGGYIAISKNKLMKEIGMISKNYGKCGQNVRKFSVFIDMDEKMIYDFFNINDSNLTSMLETALNNLQDKCIIMYSKIIKVCEKGTSTTRPATKFELQDIMKFEKETLNELGFEEISKIRVSNKWKLFQREVDTKLHNNTDIDYYCSAYEININESFIEKERNKLAEMLLEQVQRIETLNNLNSTIIENFINNSQKRKDNASGKKAKIRNNFSYIDNMKELASLLIQRNAKDITSQMFKVELPEDILANIEDLF